MAIFPTEEKTISELIYEFIEGYRINSGMEIDNIYIVNIDDEVCKEDILKEYYIENLGNVDENTLINSIKSYRR